jgi:predicted nucleotide-binding protein (sugar kinase/HSP70/actin superfamily)
LGVATVGIPRGLLYYRYGRFWADYLAGLGLEVEVSGRTTKRTVELGLARVSSEVCLPLKIMAGHIEELKDRVDYMFLPRLVSDRAGLFACPKMIGVPDLARLAVPRGCTVIAPLLKGNSVLPLLRAGVKMTGSPTRALRAYRQARLPELREPAPRISPELERGAAGARSVAVISHFYNLGDDYVARDIIDTLTGAGLLVRTKEHLPPGVLCSPDGLASSVRWIYERELYNAFRYYAPRVDGVCAVVSFGCGPDSLVVEIMQREAREFKVPFTQLVIDEHTGKAGLVTRLEAFIGMLGRRPERVRVQDEAEA